MTDQSSSASNDAAARVAPPARRAPATDRTAIIVPAWSDAPALIAENRRSFADDWMRWRVETRRDVLASAAEYTTALTGVAPRLPSDGPLIVDGHQPELFHPGVWAKNFAIDRLAERCCGTSLHLIVDNDLMTRSAVRVPVGPHELPQLAWESFDQPQSPRPWEEARIVDRALFATFAERIERHMERWRIVPLATAGWPAAQQRLADSDSLADCLNAARVAVEQSWGLSNLELPVSRLSVVPSFLRFIALLVSRSRELVAHYNSVVQEYRRVNRVRSRSHPVPDLTVEGDWYEVPFRIWRVGDARRQRPFARCWRGHWELRDDRDVLARWPESWALDSVPDELAALAAQGVRLRPRALTLTLFARLLLADLFVHGLGGAKYDEMTDALAARLFGAPPPPYLTVTATVRLPLGESPAIAPSDIGRLKHQLWDLAHNPQRYVDRDDRRTAALVEEKQSLVNSSGTGDRAARRQRYLRLRDINAELAQSVTPLRIELMRQLQTIEQQLAGQRVRLNREYSWVLFPEALLRGFYEATFPVDAGVRRTRRLRGPLR